MLFPYLAEKSLENLDPFIDSLKAKIRRVDVEILSAVRQQSSSGSHARQELRAAKDSISLMIKNMAEIRQMAASTDAMVQDVCRDLRKLDTAKKHITTTITSLRRLAMLINAVNQLQMAAEKHQYGESARLLGAIQQLESHFQNYEHIPKIAELKGRIGALRNSLRVASLREFELLGEEIPSQVLLERLRDCCAVMAVVGPMARDELVDTICRREMGVYTQIFGTIGETAKLDRTMNRYKWLLRRLEARQAIWAIFPAEWRVPQLLCVTFCSMTKTQLAEILDEKGPELPHHIESLIKAVEATNIFESEMARRFEDHRGTMGVSGESEDGEMVQRSTADVQGPASPSRAERQQKAAADAVAKAAFRGSISSVFAPYLRLYVDQVERELMWNLDQMISTEPWVALEADQPILKSSNQLTDAVRGEMKDCAARISRGQTLLDLGNVFGRVYKIYASKLIQHLPKTASGATSGVAALGAPEWQVKMTIRDVEEACLIVNTAEHCIDMLHQLSKAILSRVDGQDLEGQSFERLVDYEDVEDAFRGVVTAALSVMVLGIETKLESPLGLLVRHNWSAITTVGDQSDWVGGVRIVLEEFVPCIGSGLPPNYYHFFCDRLVRSFAPRLREAIFRCRGISDAGCQQLRLDLEAIKNGLLGLAKWARAGNDGEGELWNSSLATDVSAQLGPIEVILKLVSTPLTSLLDAFLELLPDGGPAELQRIADLKGLKRAELTAVLDAYSNREQSGKLKALYSVADNLGHADDARSRSPSLADTNLNGNQSRNRGLNAAAAAAQDMAARFRLNTRGLNSAYMQSAGDSVRETTGRMLEAMKNLRLKQQQQQQRSR